MIVIRCHECKRRYNWAGDPFCPHCGAFNQAKDYSFDRERVGTTVKDDDGTHKEVFQRKKTSTGHANNAPSHTFAGRKPVEPGKSSAQEKTNQQAQASGCLKKIIIAVVIWNIATVGLSVLANLVFSIF